MHGIHVPPSAVVYFAAALLVLFALEGLRHWFRKRRRDKTQIPKNGE